MTLLKIENLEVSFFTSGVELKAVRNVNFQINKGEILGVVGESGSGKSVTAKSIIGLTQERGTVKNGRILFENKDILTNTQNEWRTLRGNDVAMIFQDPMTSLNPVYTIGTQLGDVIRKKRQLDRKSSRMEAVKLLSSVGIPSAEKRLNSYPHEFSGGMLQRVMIAMALSCQPALLIADEPTTALDVTIQAQILSLMKGLKHQDQTSIMLITHDLGVVAEVCDRVVVMYGGFVMEEASVRDIFYHAVHPYTKGLMASIPKLGDKSRLVPIKGTPPDATSDFKGCPFYERCNLRMERCREERPPYVEISPTHHAMCWLKDKGGA